MVFLLLEIEIDGSLSSSEFFCERAGVVSSSKNGFNSFFHWLSIQLSRFIFKAFECFLAKSKMRFNADLTSYFLPSLKKQRYSVMT